MKILLLALVTTVVAQSTPPELREKQCKGVYFQERYYDIEILKEGLNNIQEMVYNSNETTLYFIFDQIAEVPNKALGYLNIKTRESGLLYGIRNSTCLAIDKTYHQVYVGSQDGIHIIKPGRVVEKLRIYDYIQSMYFKEVLFFTNSRKQALIYNNGQINTIFELQNTRVEKIVLDDDHNIFFTEGLDLYRVRIGTRAVNSHEHYRTNVLAADAQHKAYIATNNGIYVYNKYKYVFDKVSELNNVKALAFNDDGELMFSSLDFIIKLKYNPQRCVEPVYNSNY